MKQLLKQPQSNWKSKWAVFWLIVILVFMVLGFRGWRLAQINEVKASEIPQLKQQLEEINKQKTEIEKKLQTKIKVEEKIKASNEVKARTLKAVAEKFGYDEVDAFEKLITKESNFNLFALNKSSGACGIFQALPCNKLPGLDLDSQIKWGLAYIKNRYGKPSEALAFHIQKGWY